MGFVFKKVVFKLSFWLQTPFSTVFNLGKKSIDNLQFSHLHFHYMAQGRLWRTCPNSNLIPPHPTLCPTTGQIIIWHLLEFDWILYFPFSNAMNNHSVGHRRHFKYFNGWTVLGKEHHKRKRTLGFNGCNKGLTPGAKFYWLYLQLFSKTHKKVDKFIVLKFENLERKQMKFFTKIFL